MTIDRQEIGLDSLNKENIYCYSCHRKLKINENNLYFCEECNNPNGYILIYSYKYKTWLTTRNKNVNTALESAENSYQNRLNKSNNIVQERIKLVKNFNDNFEYFKIDSDDYYGHVKCNCSNCNNNFTVRYDHFLEKIDFYNENNDGEVNYILCSDCAKEISNKKASKTRSGPGICSGCGKKVKSRDASCKCKECRSKKSKEDRANNELPGFCKHCGKFNRRRNNVGLGIECGCSQKMYDERGMKYKYCPICKKETIHNESKCIECYPEAKPGGGIIFRNCINGKDHKCLHISGKCSICEGIKIGSQPNIITVDNVIFWKDESAEELVYDLLNDIKDIKDYPELEIRDGRMCYNRIDILTGDKVLLNTNFLQVKDNVVFWKGEPAEPLVNDLLSGKRNVEDYPPLEIRFKKHVCYNKKDILTGELIIYKGENITVRDNVEFVLDHSINKYVEANYFYSRQYEKMNNVVDDNIEIENLINNEGFSKELIVKINESMWNREQTDFNLANKGYGWIVYIKLLDNRPWICGKTGTRKVSNSPIDFDFIIGDKSNPDYSGPGREYARRYYPEREFSDFDFVLIRNFGDSKESEKKALEFERYIVSKYNLFES